MWKTKQQLLCIHLFFMVANEEVGVGASFKTFFVKEFDCVSIICYRFRGCAHYYVKVPNEKQGFQSPSPTH